MFAARLIELWIALISRGRLWRQTIKFLNHPINEDGRGNGHQSHQSQPQYLVGITFAIGMVFASQAFALPCPNGTWQSGHFICASYDE
jgi:hypothetical protein